MHRFVCRQVRRASVQEGQTSTAAAPSPRCGVFRFEHPAVIANGKRVRGETKVDWRTRHAVTKIYDQGTCGCCWAVSTIQAIESQWFIQKRGPLPSLSFQQVVLEFKAK
jgi:C1A family cysteine protease